MTPSWRLGVVIPTLTMTTLASFYAVDPFEKSVRVLGWVFQAGQQEATPVRFHKDTATQEVSAGEGPLAGLLELQRRWSERAKGKHIVLIGNSQTYHTIYAPGEAWTGAPERTYPDIVFAHYGGGQDGRVLGYRLPAPNITYVEALWYVRFLLSVPGLRPDLLILQLNFQAFRLTGIRDGMLEMLADDRFRPIAEQEAIGERPYAATMGQAISRWKERVAKEQRGGAQAEERERTTETGISKSFGFGKALEASLRRAVDGVPGWRDRHSLKTSLLTTLYLLRVHVLGITPSTRRSVRGATLTVNRSAFEEIAELCREHKVELVLLNAPQNPSTPLYRTQQDRELYQRVIGDVSRSFRLKLLDFEHSIPQECWGVISGGPDPIHFGREGHRRMAKLLIDSGVVRPKAD